MGSKSEASAAFRRVDTLDVDKILKWSWAFNGLAGAAALLLPLTVMPESRIQTGAANATVGATAHVNFKIVIPKVLYLQVRGANAGGGGAQTVAVMSNSHNVALTATLRMRSADEARGNLILTSAARKIIAQDAVCTQGTQHIAPAKKGFSAMPAGENRVLCTASMP